LILNHGRCALCRRLFCVPFKYSLIAGEPDKRQLAVDRDDLDFSEILAMALMLLVVLTTTHLENLHFIVTTVCHNSYQYLCTFDQWRTKLDGVARAYCENLIDGDFGTNVCRYLFYFKFFASDNFILFATGFYDRVHD
jgi:hypothetical protein